MKTLHQFYWERRAKKSRFYQKAKAKRAAGPPSEYITGDKLCAEDKKWLGIPEKILHCFTFRTTREGRVDRRICRKPHPIKACTT